MKKLTSSCRRFGGAISKAYDSFYELFKGEEKEPTQIRKIVAAGGAGLGTLLLLIVAALIHATDFTYLKARAIPGATIRVFRRITTTAPEEACASSVG